MTPAELEQAMRQFEANGGTVEIVKGFEGVADRNIRAPDKKKSSKKQKEDSPEVVAMLRTFVDLGVYAASRAMGKKPETLNKIAARNGIMFNTRTAANRAIRWQEREKLLPRISALSREGLSQVKICKELGLTRIILRAIAEKYGININSRAK